MMRTEQPTSPIARGIAVATAFAVALCAIPWLAGGGRTPFVFGLVALLCSALLCWGTRAASWFVTGFAVVMLGLLGLNGLMAGPGMSPLEIDGVRFSGSMLLLPVVAGLAPVLVRFAPVIKRK